MLGVDMDTPLADADRDKLIDSIANAIVKRRLEAPAVMFLEAHKPLSFVASQSMIVAMPLLGPLVGAQRMADMSKLLKDRENVELLIARIEDIASGEAVEGTANNEQGTEGSA